MVDIERFCLGFLFSEEKDRVALIRKKRPLWQSGKLNGIGGKIERGKRPRNAMARTFKEETGVDMPEWDWHEHTLLLFPNTEVHVFVAFSSIYVDRVFPAGDEEVSVIGLGWLTAYAYDECIPNLAWLIPAALDPWRDWNCPRPAIVRCRWPEEPEEPELRKMEGGVIAENK